MQLCQIKDMLTGTTTQLFLGGSATGAGAISFTARDHLGSVRDVTAGNGSLVSRFEYDPYGRKHQTYGGESPLEGFGAYANTSVGDLQLAAFRGYDPSTGRWLNEDPLGLPGGTNLYAYVSNRPALLADPLGLSPLFDYNFCGSGNNIGAPINELDSACEQHDLCYSSVGAGGATGALRGGMS